MRSNFIIIGMILICGIFAEVEKFSAITEVRWSPSNTDSSGRWIIGASLIVAKPARILTIESVKVEGKGKDRYIDQKVVFVPVPGGDESAPVNVVNFEFNGCSSLEAHVELDVKICEDDSEPCEKDQIWSNTYKATSGNACEVKGVVKDGYVPSFVREQMFREDVIKQRKHQKSMIEQQEKIQEGYAVMDMDMNDNPFQTQFGVPVPPKNDSEDKETFEEE
eukprot:TRINITY_DN5593_c1_g1_i3.p1 TRINITY_DN5593_c1_g1~~TRINITY_DN5593_c1_g1_i3.p1  ORF type:complete len:221 (-),score=73.00 TRINITY_DN5593_c1_g1_i3:9-671(-)